MNEVYTPSIDTSASSVSGGAEQISDAVREQVAEEGRQARQIAGQIASSKQTNAGYARFLTYIFGAIQSDVLLAQMYRLFFTTKNEYNQTIKRKDTNYPVLIGIFVPFFWYQAVEYGVADPYISIYNPNQPLTIELYITYLKGLSRQSHDNIVLDKAQLLSFIIELLVDRGLFNRAGLTKQDFDTFVHSLATQLFVG